MTTQPIETDTHIDISALVGELEAPRCEHSQHEVRKMFHDDGPATHYVRAVQVRGPMVRKVLTEAEIEIARRGLARMAEGRRRRGVPADGIDPERIQRRGLALIDV